MKLYNLFSPSGTHFVIQHNSPLHIEPYGIYRKSLGLVFFAEELEYDIKELVNINMREELLAHREDYLYVWHKFKKLMVFV